MLLLTPATNGDDNIDIGALIDYLNYNRVDFDLSSLNKAVSNLSEETTITLNESAMAEIRECMLTEITDNSMECIARFMPPSEGGELMDRAEILGDLKHRGVTFGIDDDAINGFLNNRVYMQNIVVARGTEPIQGKNAYIEYMFNTDLKARPTLLEDGSVDFFNLNIINHCSEGELLARLHREVPGTYGFDVTGQRIKPVDVRRQVLRFGRNIRLSEDRNEIYAMCPGHVNLVEGRVFVSDVMVVENVDPSTGNIEYEGNVQVNGNVATNFSIHAKGNVEVKGVVEGAEIVAGGNITIARGMNGMSRGVLKAGGNVIAKFIENSSVEASGYVEAGSLMHSQVLSGSEIHVGGKRGFISGGKVAATSLIDVKILGSDMGTDTVAEIGVSPTAKRRHKELEDLIATNIKTINRAIPIMEAARDKVEAGITLSVEQTENIKNLSSMVKEKLKELNSYKQEREELSELIAHDKKASVTVRDVVYPGVKIVISDASKIIKDPVRYCRFVKERGDVKVVGMN